MKDSYNVLELKFKGEIENVINLLKEYIKERQEFQLNNEYYYYSWEGGYFWKFLVKDQSLYILSFSPDQKSYDIKYAYNFKLFNTDFSDIEYERFQLEDRLKTNVKDLEKLINYFKNKSIDFDFNDSVLPSKEVENFVNGKTLIISDEDKNLSSKENPILSNTLWSIVTFLSPVEELFFCVSGNPIYALISSIICFIIAVAGIKEKKLSLKILFIIATITNFIMIVLSLIVLILL